MEISTILFLAAAFLAGLSVGFCCRFAQFIKNPQTVATYDSVNRKLKYWEVNQYGKFVELEEINEIR
jgi:hypothetical protein